MTNRMLRTGDVADMLDMSRQGVANLCDRGELEHVRVGTHRRIPAHAVESYVLRHRRGGNGHQRSLTLHALVVSKLVADPEAVLSVARRCLARRDDPSSETYTEQWRALVDGPLPNIIAAMLDTSAYGTTMRSCTPFAGVLDETELAAVNAAMGVRFSSGSCR